MSRPRKVDLATAEDVDWSFTEDEAFMEALSGRVSYIAGRQGLDADDLYSEVVMYIAVRPEWGRRERKDPSFPVLTVAEQMRGAKRDHLQLSDIQEPAVGLDGR